jgi:peptidoglycan/LPS O-acetylase OafA/YrhL
LKTGAHLVANYAYAIYLTHTTAMWVALVYLTPYDSLLVRWSVLVLLSIALPPLAYHLIERPMIQWANARAMRWFGTHGVSRRLALRIV